MARYIDADRFAMRIELSPAFKNAGHEGDLLQSVVLDLLDNAPDADVEEVKHGEWVEDVDGLVYCCTNCGNPVEYQLTNYCPDCGTKMDGGNAE